MKTEAVYLHSRRIDRRILIHCGSFGIPVQPNATCIDNMNGRTSR